MAVLVDSNVILDVATEDPTWGEWSARALENITGERVMYRNASGKMTLPYNLYR